MTITTPTTDRAQKLKDAGIQLLAPGPHSVREVAAVLGLTISSFPGVMYGNLHYGGPKWKSLKI